MHTSVAILDSGEDPLNPMEQSSERWLPVHTVETIVLSVRVPPPCTRGVLKAYSRGTHRRDDCDIGGDRCMSALNRRCKHHCAPLRWSTRRTTTSAPVLSSEARRSDSPLYSCCLLHLRCLVAQVISMLADPNDESPANIDAAVQSRPRPLCPLTNRSLCC